MAEAAVRMAPEVTARRRRPFTRTEIVALAASGVLESKRYELLNGDLYDRMKNPLTAYVVAVLYQWLCRSFPGYAHIEATIDVSPEDTPTNAPVPDLLVLRKPLRDFRTTTPGPADIALLIEVSDSTLRDDLNVKAGLYARAGIPEYWVFDAKSNRVHAHRQPVDGHYSSISVIEPGQALSPLVNPQAALNVNEVLSPAGA